jgi:hypothetical protein
MKLDPLGVEITEDRLTATLSCITSENDYEGIVRFIQSQKIISGIDHEGIRNAVNKANRGQDVYGIVVARGRPPKVLKKTEAAYHLPPEVMHEHNISSQMTDFEMLKHILDGPHLDAIKSYNGIVKLVGKGDPISELVDMEVERGEDIYGDPIEIQVDDELFLEFGDNTDLSEDGNTCTSAIFGYAGIIDNIPTVLPPIWVSEDHMEARFVHILPPDGEKMPVPNTDDLAELLEAMWIFNGLMEKQFELIQKRLARGLPLPVTLPIAQGTHEVPGEDAQIRYAFDAFSIPPWNHIQTFADMETPEEINEMLQEMYQDPEMPNFTAFRPGQLVIEKVPATEKVIGRDVQGEQVVPEPGQDIPLEFGYNLEIDNQGLVCAAEIFGYVCLQWDIQVTMLSPLWIAPDKTKVYFLNLPQNQPSKYPNLEEMKLLLKRFEITFGFNAERWTEILAELEAGTQSEYLILIVEGRSAQPGRDADFEWAVDVGDDKKVGKILDDGTIDYRERGLITVIQENDILGRLVPPEPGVVGKDVFGNELRPPNPINIEVVTDSRIYAEPEDDGVIAFFAGVSGGIAASTKEKIVNNRTSRRINVGVNPTSNIDGDIDYSTGNIDFNGDVFIGGSVQSQFSVRATGSVTIGGYVETGAYITAGRDITIKRGIVGASTELIAGGNVMAKYIQEASVRAAGDINVGSYVFNASIRATGQILIAGKGEGKSRALVGGLVWGAEGISAKSIGSPYNTSTKLVAGINPDHVNRTDQIRANLLVCQEKQCSMLDRIGVANLDVALIKQKLSAVRSPKDKQKILLSVKRITKIAELEQNLQNEMEEIAKAQRRLGLKTRVDIQKELFAGVELRIGELTHIVNDDQISVSFGLAQDDEELIIQMNAYRPPKHG